MKTIFQKLFLALAVSLALFSCSSDSSSLLNSNESRLIGYWEYRVSPHPSGAGSTASYYKSFFTLQADKTGTRGFEEVISATDHFSDSKQFTWTVTATQISATSSNGTVETSPYVLIDDNNIRITHSNGNVWIYTKY